MTWTEPEVQIAERADVSFAFGSLTEETDYDYEVSLDPTFSTGVFGGQFRTTAEQNDTRLAGVTFGGTALDFSAYDLSVQTDLAVEGTASRGVNAVAATAVDGNATVMVSQDMFTVTEAQSISFTVTVTNQTSSRVYNVYLTITGLVFGDFNLHEDQQGTGNVGPVDLWLTADHMLVLDGTGNIFRYTRSTFGHVDTQQFTFGGMPRGLAANDDASRVYVALSNNTIQSINTSGASWSIVLAEGISIPDFIQPYGLHWENDRLFLMDGTAGNRFFAFNPTTLARDTSREIHTRPSPGVPSTTYTGYRGLWLTPTRAYGVTAAGGVRVYDRSTESYLAAESITEATMDNAGNANRFGGHGLGSVLWVPDNADDKVYGYDTGTRQHLG